MKFINVDDQTGVEAPVDLTNMEIVLQARYQPDDLTPVFTLPWTLVGSAKNGIGYFTLNKTLSESLAAPYGQEKRNSGSYDVQFWSKTDPEAAFSPVKGNWRVELDVTRKK
ncbi:MULTISPECIES: hypothetical protein [unclassified Aeromonas]|uniref:hypothetical protein n=1 Tax=unclassified Aeromonas TaxID=257493 RepID=UPI0022E7B1B7|nr:MULTISPECIES: hypothetical protein [unclassified Aeromonas]